PGRTQPGNDVLRRSGPVRRHLPAAGAGIFLRPDGGEQQVERRHPELEAERAIAVVGEEPVVARFEGEASGDEDGLVAGAADLKEDPALVLELYFLVVESARQEHAAVHGQQLVATEALEGAFGGGSRGRFASGDSRFHARQIITSGLLVYAAAHEHRDRTSPPLGRDRAGESHRDAVEENRDRRTRNDRPDLSQARE